MTPLLAPALNMVARLASTSPLDLQMRTIRTHGTTLCVAEHLANLLNSCGDDSELFKWNLVNGQLRWGYPSRIFKRNECSGSLDDISHTDAIEGNFGSDVVCSRLNSNDFRCFDKPKSPATKDLAVQRYKSEYPTDTIYARSSSTALSSVDARSPQTARRRPSCNPSCKPARSILRQPSGRCMKQGMRCSVKQVAIIFDGCHG